MGSGFDSLVKQFAHQRPPLSMSEGDRVLASAHPALPFG
jgi:hypothetical protein